MAAGRQSLTLTAVLPGGCRLSRLLACDQRKTPGVRACRAVGAAAGGTGATAAGASRPAPRRGFGAGPGWLAGASAVGTVRVIVAPARLPARMLPSGARKRVVSESCRLGSQPARTRSRRWAKTSPRKEECRRPWHAERAGMGGFMLARLIPTIPAATKSKLSSQDLPHGARRGLRPCRVLTGRRRGSRCCKASRRR